MKGMIFAAGLGTRLKPFTLSHPKALVPVGGVPMLLRVIEKFKKAGIDEIVVNVHHFADQIVTFLQENDNFRVNIHISDETDLLLDTGGGILRARKWLEDGPFFVHNADILTDFPILEMIASHNNSGADATLLCASRDTSRYLLFDNHQNMRGWENVKTGELKPAGLKLEGLSPLAFGGVHILNPTIFPFLEQYSKKEGTTVFSIVPFYVANCQNLVIKAFQPSQAYNWHDVGNPESLAKANSAIAGF